MISVNMAIVVGNVGHTPKVTRTESGKMVANFTIATTDGGYTSASGAVIPETTQWHNVVAWGKTAEFISKYVTSGSQVYVQGKMHSRKYIDRNNNERLAFEIECDKLQLLYSKQKVGIQQQEQVVKQDKVEDVPF